MHDPHRLQPTNHTTVARTFGAHRKCVNAPSGEAHLSQLAQRVQNWRPSAPVPCVMRWASPSESWLAWQFVMTSGLSQVVAFEFYELVETTSFKRRPLQQNAKSVLHQGIYSWFNLHPASRKLFRTWLAELETRRVAQIDTNLDCRQPRQRHGIFKSTSYF